MNRPIFVSWVKDHGRSRGLADVLGISGYFIDGGEGGVVARYRRQWAQTVRIVRDSRPSHVIVMQPPIIALLAVRAASRGTGAVIIGDLHSGAFLDPKWRWSTSLALRLLRGRNGAIVTNSALGETVSRAGARHLVVHDLIVPDDRVERHSRPDAAHPTVLVPLGYGSDEPIAAILDAARSIPGTTFHLTGRAPESVRSSAPTNVEFTGYLPLADYRALVARSDVMLALTTRPHTMQRVGYEALAAGKALVVSDHDVLSDYFGSAAVYTDNSVASLVSGVEEATTNRARLESLMVDLRSTKLDEQQASVESLRTWLFDG